MRRGDRTAHNIGVALNICLYPRKGGIIYIMKVKLGIV